jgi:hypothetical protein
MVKTAACSVDVCGRCKGLWLEASELGALRRARPNVAGAVAVGAAAAVATAAVVTSLSGPVPSQHPQYNTLKVAGEVMEEGLELAVDGDAETLTAVVEASGGLLELVSSGLDTGVEAVVGLIGALFD